MNKIIHGDCLEIMPTLDIKVDMILADLPYGTTICKWDTIIPFEPLWGNYKRLIKDNGVIILMGKQPFTTDIINSNRKDFRYELIWEKNYSGSFILAKKMPMQYHENILIFYKKLPTYNPQKTKASESTQQRFKKNGKFIKGFLETNNIQGIKKQSGKIDINKIYPKSVLKIKGVPNCNGIRQHPTQKPLRLFEWLIKTYTNEGETVLDNTAGSMTTAIACINTNRKYICIEKDKEYYEKGKQRVEDHLGLFKEVI